MKFWRFLTSLRCPFCFKPRKMFRVLLLSRREGLIREQTAFLLDKEKYLKKLETILEDKWEAVCGNDATVLKRKILLDALKRKWEAERLKLDADRVIILKSTKHVHHSIKAIQDEAEKVLENLKKKPSTTFNSAITNEYSGKLKGVLEVIKIIDAEKNNGMEKNSSN